MSKLFLALAVLAMPALALLPDEQNNVDIYQKCNPAVVNITAVTLTQDFFFDVVPQRGVGSGAIIRPDGYILTNHHVVGNAQRVEVTLFDKSNYPAKVVGLDADSDLAVLKIDTKGQKLPHLDYTAGAAGKLSVGQKVLAIGNPFGLGGSLSVGVISSLGRDIKASNERTIKDVIQTDAAINPGNSGGPLIDSSGKLIGMNTQIVSTSGGSEGIGFAISATTLKKLIDQVIEFGQVLRPTLGVAGVGFPPTLLQSLGIPLEKGVMLTETYKGSPIDKAGLKVADRELILGFRRIPVGGDIVFRLDDTPVGSLREILDYIGDKKPGESIDVHYVRGKARKTTKVTLALPPNVRKKTM
jgi:S1-C subfamily serine protease